MKIRKIAVLALLVLFVFSAVAFAQGTPKLELKIAEKKMNMTEGEKMGKEKIKYRPGDVIKYTVWAQNTGTGMITDPVITDPIPMGVEYKPRSATGNQAKISYSIDGGKTYQSWPPKYKTKDQNGRTVTRAASPDMITHIQWRLKKSLAPKESKQFEFEVTVK